MIELKGNSRVEYNALNAREIVVKGIKTKDITIQHKETKTTNYITTITFNDQHSISLEDSLEVPNGRLIYNYKINYIEKISNTNFLLSIEKLNKSSFYALPSIFENKADIGWNTSNTGIDNTSFINAYIGSNMESIGEYIYIKYLFLPSDSFKALETTLKGNTNFTNFIDEGQYVTFKFKIPDIYKYDIINFSEGKYSEFSTPYKAKILKFHSKKYNKEDVYYRDYLHITKDNIDKLTNPLALGLFKHPSLKLQLEQQLGMNIDDDLELVSKPNLEYELLL